MASKIVINLDTSKENYILAKCKQNDDLTLEASIFENGLEKDLTNCEITIQALKADKTYIIQNTNITKENNKIIADLDRDFTRAAGKTEIEIVLVESGKQNTTFSFTLEVVGSVIRGAVESSNTVTILEELDNKIVEAGQVKEETEQLIATGGAATTGDIQEINSQLEQNTNKINNIKKINVLDYDVKNDGLTDNTEVINDLLNKGLTNLYFPKGEYAISIDCISRMTIEGDGKNETILKQVKNSNKNVINIVDGVSFIDIKNLSIEGTDGNSKGNGIYVKGITSDLYCNYVFLENVEVRKMPEDGFHCSGYSVENKITNSTFNECGKRNVYNEGHDLFMINVKMQRAGEENFIQKGANFNGTNLHMIYGNMLQKNLNKDDVSLKYSLYVTGSRGSYNNVDCQDCFGHGVKIENAKDINLANFLVDSVGINKDETEWWEPNSPNACCGFNIINSTVNANSTHVTNWHNNQQGASYIIDGLSKLTGQITRNNTGNIVTAPIVKTDNIYGLSFEGKLFEGLKNVLNKATINWGYTLVHSGTPTYGSARYGDGVYFNAKAENMSITTTSMNNNADFELSFTYTPKVAWDGTNTRWLMYGEYAGNLLECLVSSTGNLTIRYYDNSKYYTIKYDEVLTKEYPYRIFIKIIGNKFITKVYKYAVLMGEYNQTLDIVPSNGATTLYFGNNKTPQTYWSCNGIIEDIHISKCIPQDYDFKEIDERIKVTPLTLFKANLDNSLK